MSRTTRRHFAQLAGIAAAAPLVLPQAGLSQTSPSPAAPVAPAVSRPLAAALTEVIRAQWGAHLDAGQMQKIGEDMNDVAGAIERLRKFPLTNADEPDASFAALSGRVPKRKVIQKA